MRVLTSAVEEWLSGQQPAGRGWPAALGKGRPGEQAKGPLVALGTGLLEGRATGQGVGRGPEQRAAAVAAAAAAATAVVVARWWAVGRGRLEVQAVWLPLLGGQHLQAAVHG